MVGALLVALPALAGDIRVEVLDVGQGDAILIRTPANKVVLIDAGDGDTDVSALLRGKGVDHLDLAIASHPHADHIGGMQKVVEALPPKLYVDSGLTHTTETYQSLMRTIEAREIPYRTALSGTTVNLDDGATLEILFPGDSRLTNTRSDLNANSVVTRLRHGEDCFLFTGDAEEPTERALLDAGLGQCDVLKVAHHGSNHSTTHAWLDVVKPKIALISAGADNRYGHPGRDTMSRLTAAEATVYRTDQQGEIAVISTGKGVTVTTGHARADAPLAVVAEAPRAAPSAAPTQQPGAAACAFIASRNSEVFHEASCGNGLKISPANLICYATKEEALAAGRRSAGCCHP